MRFISDLAVACAGRESILHLVHLFDQKCKNKHLVIHSTHHPRLPCTRGCSLTLRVLHYFRDRTINMHLETRLASAD